MSFRAIFGSIFAKIRHRRWGPMDVNALAEELYDAFASQGPIVLSGPIVVHNPTLGPAVTIVNTATSAENAAGIEISDASGRKVEIGIGLGSRGLFASNFVYDESSRTDPLAVTDAYGKAGKGGQVVYDPLSDQPAPGFSYLNNKKSQVASGYSYDNAGSGIPDVNLSDVESTSWDPLPGIGEMLGSVATSDTESGSADGTHPPGAAFVSDLNGVQLWWPTDLHAWTVNRCTILEINADTLTCQRDGLEDDIEVAKPYSLQRVPFDKKTINGVLYSYTSNQTRTASNAAASEEQEISPSYDGTTGYSPGNVLYARWVSNGTGIDDVNYIDINADARAWISSG